jgi:uncharacterized protein
MREGQPAVTGVAILAALATDGRYEFRPDDVPCTDVRMTGVIGHPRQHRGRLATFDESLAALHRDVA